MPYCHLAAWPPKAPALGFGAPGYERRRVDAAARHRPGHFIDFPTAV